VLLPALLLLLPQAGWACLAARPLLLLNPCQIQGGQTLQEGRQLALLILLILQDPDLPSFSQSREGRCCLLLLLLLGQQQKICYSLPLGGRDGVGDHPYPGHHSVLLLNPARLVVLNPG
jgi:hypothetical protein